MVIADLHIHSNYSRATSRDCVPEQLDYYACRKGINLVGTGDFTHPAWRAELKEKLCPDGNGFYTLRPEYARKDSRPPDSVQPKFVLTGEISSIYKHNGKTRKVHNVIILPGLEAAEQLARRLEAVGNLHSDGRPILGLSSHDLLDITMDSCPDAIFIPAHIWTPHFSVFGAFSAYSTMEECFEDLTPCIHAVETGLSSDPAMNWRVPAVDGFQLVSNSDAHSPQKLGREANLLTSCGSYEELSAALSGKNPQGLYGTIEFFPEEGKYHADGHRNCNICLTPEETAACGGRCPVCGRKLTIGVEHRVEEMAKRPAGYRPENAKPYESLVPLTETIAWSTGTSPAGVRAAAQYESMLEKLGTEFYVLRECPLEDIRRVAGDVITEGIRRLRNGEVKKKPGFDGQYGVIQLLSPEETETFGGQVSLFGAGIARPKKAAKKKITAPIQQHTEEIASENTAAVPNIAQQKAIAAVEGTVAVIAGPGSGKTRTLIQRIAHLIRDCGVKASEITAVTFTKKAAEELQERLEKELGGKKNLRGMTVGTFHRVCMKTLPSQSPVFASSEQAKELGEKLLHQMQWGGDVRGLLQEISRVRGGSIPAEPHFPAEAASLYTRMLHEAGLTDYDDILEQAAKWFRQHPAGRNFTHLLVDEFQDCSPVQYELVQLWSKKSRSLFVIGDPDQAIYGFRGADSACFERLAQDYPEIQIITLQENYRSSPEILDGALGVISGNGEPRVLHSNCPSGGKIREVYAGNPTAEGIFAAKEISRLTGGIDMLEARSDSEEPPRSFSDIAILCRTRRQLELMEKCLRHDDIPCITAGRGSYLENKEVKGLCGFLGFLENPADFPGLEQSLSLCGCPGDLSDSICRKFRQNPPENAEKAGQLLEEYRILPVLNQWFSVWEEFLTEHKKEKSHKLLENLAGRLKVEDREEVQHLIGAAAFYPERAEFLEALQSPEEDALIRLSGKMYESGAVTLMTLHGSKGLEFPVVLICGVEQGSIPHETSSYPTSEAEERRLFFVGMTRAKEKLYLLSSGTPSAFLADIPAAVTETEKFRNAPPAAEGVQLSLF